MIAGPSRLVLLGNPVSHSLSPVFQNAALRSEGISLTYEAIEVAAPDLGHVLTLFAEDNAAGNITIPHKEAAAALCAAGGARRGVVRRVRGWGCWGRVPGRVGAGGKVMGGTGGRPAGMVLGSVAG